MKLLRVIASMNPALGGPCQGIRNSIASLNRLGFTNEVVCLDEDTSAYLGKDNFKIHCLNGSNGPWCYNKYLMPWLIEKLPQYDAVIIHGLWLYTSFAVWNAIKYLKGKWYGQAKHGFIPKVYVMPHGMLDPYFQEAPGRRIKAFRNWLYWKVVESKVVNSAEGVLFTCKAELELARLPFKPYHPQKEINVGYGIKTPPVFDKGMVLAFNEQCAGINNSPYFLFLSRIHEKKGIDILITAYINICNEYFDIPKLVIAGPGIDTVYGRKILKIVADNNLSEKVLFAGMLTGDAKWGAFYGCEAFILPSHQENFGIANVEALACGKPVLITNKVNIWQEIEMAGAGIVADDTTAGIQGLLEKWLGSSYEIKKLYQQRAMHTFQTLFTSDQAAKQMASAFRSLS